MALSGVIGVATLAQIELARITEEEEAAAVSVKIPFADQNMLTINPVW